MSDMYGQSFFLTWYIVSVELAPRSPCPLNNLLLKLFEHTIFLAYAYAILFLLLGYYWFLVSRGILNFLLLNFVVKDMD